MHKRILTLLLILLSFQIFAEKSVVDSLAAKPEFSNRINLWPIFTKNESTTMLLGQMYYKKQLPRQKAKYRFLFNYAGFDLRKEKFEYLF